MSAPTIARRWARRIAVGRVRVVRLRGDVARLLASHAELQERLAHLEAELHDVRIRAGAADDALARLSDGLATTSSTVEQDLSESRRLSLRVAQMTDVLFDRLAERSGDQPTRAETGRPSEPVAGPGSAGNTHRR